MYLREVGLIWQVPHPCRHMHIYPINFSLERIVNDVEPHRVSIIQIDIGRYDPNRHGERHLCGHVKYPLTRLKHR
jgi:hypothetical protein